MNRYRQRIEQYGQWDDYCKARTAGDLTAMELILRKCAFTAMEVESILWAKGGLGPETPEISGRENLVGRLWGSFALAIIFGVVGAYYGGGFGGSFSSHRREREWASERVMSDYRTPREAYGIPFLIGAAFGAAVPWLSAAALKRKSRSER